jgi:hypothetical protein
MKHFRVVLALSIFILTLTSVWGQKLEEYQGTRVLSGRVIIKFKTPADVTTIDDIRNYLPAARPRLSQPDRSQQPDLLAA